MRNICTTVASSATELRIIYLFWISKVLFLGPFFLPFISHLNVSRSKGTVNADEYFPLSKDMCWPAQGQWIAISKQCPIYLSPPPSSPPCFYIFVAIIVVKLEITDGQMQSDGKKIVGDLFYFDKKLTLPFVFVRRRLYFSLYHELWNLSRNG